MRLEPLRHGLQKLVWIPAVVVRKCDHVSFSSPQTDVTRAGKSPLRTKMMDLDCWVFLKCRQQAVVRILINQDDFKVFIGLPLQTTEQSLQFLHAVQSGHNE